MKLDIFSVIPEIFGTFKSIILVLSFQFTIILNNHTGKKQVFEVVFLSCSDKVFPGVSMRTDVEVPDFFRRLPSNYNPTY